MSSERVMILGHDRPSLVVKKSVPRLFSLHRCRSYHVLFSEAILRN